MKLIALCVLTGLLSTQLLADDKTVVGSVIKITGDTSGLHFEINAGLPVACQNASSQLILIEKENIPAMTIISSSLMARFVTVTADYDANSKVCIARSVTME